jgi:uncharacterized protein YggT (Ycf19 family)
MVLKFILFILIIGLFLYSKLLPHKDKLDLKYQRIFNFFNSIYQPLLNFLRRFIKPFQVGFGLSIDTASLVLMIILILFITAL